MVGIYKFTNKISGKSYIGQSVNIERRYRDHKSRIKAKNNCEKSYFHNALKKYGFDNFDFEVLEECSQSELNNKEKYYINKYNTLFPNGYNISKGGRNPANRKIDFETRKEILNLLKDSKMPITEIANKYNLHINTVSQINRGELWFDENVNYPIREYIRSVQDKTKYDKNTYTCNNCGKILKYKSKNNLCKDCYYKIKSKHIPTKQYLYNLLLKNPFERVGTMFGVTGNAVRKWCDKYGIPRNSNYYKMNNNK